MMRWCKQLLIFCILVFVANMVLGGEWSACSRTCGVGIMHRAIPCQDCDGARKEFRSCNVKRCSDGDTDYRSEQCKTFGEELMSFINKSDPCKLLCSSPGENPVIKGLVVDGTPCPSSGVCVDGQCVPFGCDGVLGSKKTINKCGTCSDLCVELPCKFEEITFNNYHTTLPYESTNISIAMGASSCSFKAISSDSTKSQHFSSDQSDISMFGTVFTINDNELTAEGPLQSSVTIEAHCPRTRHKINCNYHMSVHIPHALGISNSYEWAAGENFTPCSQTCGIGIQMLEIYCRITHTNIRVSNLKCSDLSKKGINVQTRFCYQPQCPPKWIHSDWTPCSESCHGGYRERNVSCIRVIRDGIKPVLATGCDDETKQTSWQECNQHPCHNHWHTEKWNRCSVDCGEGNQSRRVMCKDTNGYEIPRYNCSSLPKPHSERSCSGDMCVHKWITSNWSNCSVSCGEGVQTRHVNCTENGTVVEDSVCLENIPNYHWPKKKNTCQGPVCNGEWAVSSWLNCFAPECHKAGIQHRNIYCIHSGSTSEEYDHIKCDPTTEPSHIQECYVTDECRPGWVTSNWTQCSKTCDGIQTRSIKCKLGNKTLADERCQDSKPSVVQSCGPDCSCSKICDYVFCHKDNLPQCHTDCCKYCDKNMPPYFSPKQRYDLCDKPCCCAKGLFQNDRDHCRDDFK